MKKLLLLCMLVLSLLPLRAETWTPVGQVQWTEGALTGWSSKYNYTWNVSVERSDDRPDVYQLQPYANIPLNKMGLDSYKLTDNVYVYLHTKNPLQVYIEYYIYNCNYGDQYFHVWQRCPENGFDVKYYGTIKDDSKTIEFPVGAFAVDISIGSSKKSQPSSYAKNSEAIHKIVFPEGVLDYTSTPETFVNVGKGQWEDCFFNGSQAKEIAFERSLTRDGVFRTYPYGEEPVIIHAADESKVWLEAFIASGYKFTQQCSENGSNSSKYGKLTNGRIEIPSDYFTIVNMSSNQSQSVTGKTLVITMPDGYSTPFDDDNGVYMGIISFSNELDNMPITPLNKITEPAFVDFVNNMSVGNNTLLYYGVEQAVSTIVQPEYPDNLTNAIIITFTDGLDKGSLALREDMLNGKDYANYLSDLISKTKVTDVELQTYAIGLEGPDVVDKDLFMYNLQSLSSKPENAHKVDDIDGVNEELYKIYENLHRQTSQRVLKLSIPMPDHEARIRFTFDGVSDPDKVEQSTLWFEGTFDRLNMVMKNAQYGGFSSVSGENVSVARDEQNALNILIILNDCRDENGEILEIEQKNIKQWDYIASNDKWQPNTEIEQDNNIKIDDIKTSAAIMLVLDCSTSLGDKYNDLKQTAISFIDRLAGGDGNYSGIQTVIVEDEIDWSDAEYYNLQGIRVVAPTSGLYIQRKGNSTRKIVIR